MPVCSSLLYPLESREVPAVASPPVVRRSHSQFACDNAPTSVLVNQTPTTKSQSATSPPTAPGPTRRHPGWAGSTSSAASARIRSRAAGRPTPISKCACLGVGGNDNLSGGFGREVLNGGTSATIRSPAAAATTRSSVSEEATTSSRAATATTISTAGNGDDSVNWRRHRLRHDVLTGRGGDDIVLIAIDSSTFDSIDPGLKASTSSGVDKNGRMSDGVIGGPRGLSRSPQRGDRLRRRGSRYARSTATRITETPRRCSAMCWRHSAGGRSSSPNGPNVLDIKQGRTGDCWILAGLGTIANENPNVIQVQRRRLRRRHLRRPPGPRPFYRVDNDLPVAVNTVTSS